MLEVNIPNFAGINLPSQFQDVSLELSSAYLYKFSLPFKAELKLKHTTLLQREGLILILTDTSGHVGLGEISPLPGFSRETLETAIFKTTMLMDRLINFGEFTPQPDSEDCLNWEEHPTPSVVHFGVETALLSLLANTKHISLGAMLYGHSSNKIPINALIRGSLSDWTPEAIRLAGDGYTTLKIKVGRVNPELEARGILEMRQAVGADVKLRLDANRSWDMETALEFGKTVSSAQIEYIEEPLNDPTELPIFYNHCGVHFAFDETLHGIIDPTLSFKSYTGLKALVLKPTLIGCTARFLALVKQAKDQNVLPVLSSSYESDVGLTILAQLAASISGKEIAVGLDTCSAFTVGTTKKRLSTQQGWMPVRTLTTQDLDFRHCELIYES